MRSYLRSLLVTAVVCWLLAGVVDFAAFRSGLAGLKTVNMLTHQINKIEHSEMDGAILFLGDSSLGTTIDASTFAQLSGFRVINASLNGAFGYAGDYNLLRRALHRGKPALVVLVHASDMMTRPVSYQGFAQSVGDLAELREVPLGELIRLYFSMDSLSATLEGVRRWIAGKGSESFTDTSADTYEQGQPMSALDIGMRIRRARYLPNEINPEKTRYLERLVALCKASNVPCFYAHGPLYEGVCRDSRDYFERARATIEGVGIEMVKETPVCMPLAQTGDSEDHPAPAFKRDYTKRYYQRLAPYLPGPAG